MWQDQDDTHSLIILARSVVLPYLIGSYFKANIELLTLNFLLVNEPLFLLTRLRKFSVAFVLGIII